MSCKKLITFMKGFQSLLAVGSELYWGVLSAQDQQVKWCWLPGYVLIQLCKEIKFATVAT